MNITTFSALRVHEAARERRGDCFCERKEKHKYFSLRNFQSKTNVLARNFPVNHSRRHETANKSLSLCHPFTLLRARYKQCTQLELLLFHFRSAGHLFAHADRGNRTERTSVTHYTPSVIPQTLHFLLLSIYFRIEQITGSLQCGHIINYFELAVFQFLVRI